MSYYDQLLVWFADDMTAINGRARVGMADIMSTVYESGPFQPSQDNHVKYIQTNHIRTLLNTLQ